MAKKAVAAETKPAVREISRMQVKYNTEVVPALMKTFGYKTVMEVPKIAKIVLNMRFGDIKDNSKSMQMATNEVRSHKGEELRRELQSQRRTAGRRHGYAPPRQNVELLRQAYLDSSSPRQGLQRYIR